MRARARESERERERDGGRERERQREVAGHCSIRGIQILTQQERRTSERERERARESERERGREGGRERECVRGRRSLLLRGMPCVLIYVDKKVE